MDYVVGNVAALISGNVTPNRPKALKRAQTPMKHQPSPNVTPKSELVGDRSIFLSPTTQKKKAIVKKSPKRIFQNPDLDVSKENDATLVSPKADKVKKHLKKDLEANVEVTPNILSPKSPKDTRNNSVESPLNKKRSVSVTLEIPQSIQVNNESTPKKKKKKHVTESQPNVTNGTDNIQITDLNTKVEPVGKGTPKKKKKLNEFTVETINTDSQITEEAPEPSVENVDNKNKKGKKKSKKQGNEDKNLEIDSNKETNVNIEDAESGKKKKKRKKKSPKNKPSNLESKSEESIETTQTDEESDFINPNAITNDESDSEHESDDDIESENEESNKAVLDTGPEASSDDEEEKEENKKEKKVADKETVKEHVMTEEEVKRTLFVGNVPFSSKCKKEVKKIFSKYGDIETVRIRTVPVKDARVTPKLAVIKKELHPDRSTVNVYIKFKQPSSVTEALVENNTVLNDHHLRVSRSDVTGSEHDPRCSVFVGNIPFALEDEGLRAKFDKCGQIESVRIVRDKKTNAGKGFGYVNFASKDGVELALMLTDEDLTIKNRILRVKRCTQVTANKQRSQQNQKRPQNHQGQKGYQERQQNYQGRQQGLQGRQQGYQERQQNFQGRQQGLQGRQQGFQGRQQNFQGRQGFQGRQQGFQGRQQGFQGRQQNSQMNRFSKNQFGNDGFQRRNQNADGEDQGAHRRILNKRKIQDAGDGPPSKFQRDTNQPSREKKPRKEFVGMTAEKKKFQKRKLNKDQKKKKSLSEILTKPRQ